MQQRVMAEKRSSGFAHSSSMRGGSPKPSRPFSAVRRRPEASAALPARSLLKPLLATISVYATVAATAWELWRSRAGGSGGGARARREEGEAPASAEAGEAARPRASLSGEALRLQGELLQASWAWADPGTSGLVGDQRRREAPRGFVPQALRANGLDMGWRELFELAFRSGQRVRARDCRLVMRSALTDVAGLDTLALVAGEAVTLRCPSDLEVHWSAQLLRLANGVEVLRVRLSWGGGRAAGAVENLTLWNVRTAAGCPAANFTSVEVPDAGRQQGISCFQPAGAVDGSPLVDPALGVWMTVEHPRATHVFYNGTLAVGVASPAPNVAYLASFGTALPSGSMGGPQDAFPWLRRHFLGYLDTVRVSRQRQKLQYATWYDLRRKPCVDSSPLGLPFCSAAQPLNEAKSKERLRTVQSELASRGVRLEGVLLDDGWDSPDEPWQVDGANFPNGLAPLRAAAAELGVSIGVWLSPWGGFGEGGKRRLRLGAARGFETYEGSPNTFRLAGPRYRAHFRSTARELVLRAGLRVLKFDGIGAGAGATGAGRFAEDVDSLLHLSAELQDETASDGDLWITVSTGSWPSPFWLLSANALWRGGPDLGRQGVGSPRQQWITFRDAMVHSWVVRRAPLFPLSGLALGGVVWSSVEEPGAYLSSYDLEDFTTEVRSFFLSGAALQDLLIQPALLQPAHWEVLADAVNVSRRHSAVLSDAHWAGGDPAKGEVYGYASYECPPCLGLLSWRNPLPVPQNFTFSLRSALSLPQAWPGGAVGGQWHLKPLWPAATASPAVPLEPRRLGPVALDEALRFELRGFELWAVEALPLAP